MKAIAMRQREKESEVEAESKNFSTISFTEHFDFLSKASIITLMILVIT